ncbi:MULTISPECIES: hypothetical protein [Cytobacillus]|uniref:hypothetical protein n=1 Tax=Cytobacillus TaxID=2675230 RepID=UPI002040DF92|nr:MULTISPECIES: hypothetical protein [Cytobacillus]MCM3393725.1 hypothetical protein [Cytobacillus oceanisediminis]UQX54098.1 hypothetical protein M5V91_26255 [Cytobacillus pseudoceanisediminis]
MRVVIETVLIIEGSRGSSRGEFFVRNRDFKDDPNFAVAIVAYEWIQQQWRESGCRDMIIEMVTWNKVNEITDDVKQIRPVVKDDLPF